MCKADIDELGLAVGELANIRSANGEMNEVTVYEHDMPPGSVMAYYPEANVLTGTEVDPRSRTPSFKHTAVAVAPIP